REAAHQRQRPPALRGGGAGSLGTGAVLVLRTMREVQACAVHPGRDELSHELRGAARGADRGEDLRAPGGGGGHFTQTSDIVPDTLRIAVLPAPREQPLTGGAFRNTTGLYAEAGCRPRRSPSCRLVRRVGVPR